MTPLAGQIIDATPSGQLLILKPANSDLWHEGYLSQEVADHLDAIGLRNGIDGRLGVYQTGRRAGRAIHLTLYDLRGSACTRLVRAGLDFGQLAPHMGRNPSYASRTLDFYLALDTGQSERSHSQAWPQFAE